MSGERASATTSSPYAEIDEFREWGIRSLITTRSAGTFSLTADEPASVVMARWERLQRDLFGASPLARLATARQVHGAHVLVHDSPWYGWLRGPDADGHVAPVRGIAMAVGVADCVPIFVAHPSGAAAVVHSGWRGTVANVLATAVRELATRGAAASELRVVLGAAVCGDCYEVSAEVYGRLTGVAVTRPTTVDLRAVIARQAAVLGVRDVRTDAACTRCHNDRFYSHRAGDAGRQIAVLLAQG